MSIVINLNDHASITLTARGAKILNRYFDARNNDIPPDLRTTLKEPRVYEEGDTFSGQLWGLLSIFGESCYMGPQPPFLRNEIVITATLKTVGLGG